MYPEQDLSCTRISPSLPRMLKAQGGDSGSFSPETPGCLALQRAWGSASSEYIWMDGGFLKWAELGGLEIQVLIGPET